jgi:hypothetical protein
VQFQISSGTLLNTDEDSLLFLNHLSEQVKDNGLRLTCLASWYRMLTDILMHDYNMAYRAASKTGLRY